MSEGSTREEMGEFCIDMLMIAKCFERIGDPCHEHCGMGGVFIPESIKRSRL